MAIVSISRIQHRRGLQQDLPLLASAELGWSLDTQRLYIGNGSTSEGAPRTGISEILTEHSDVLALAETYTFKNEDAGYTPTTGGKNSKYNAIAYGADTYVAVGVNGSIIVSVDAEIWTPVYGGTANTLNDVCFGNGLFVAVGASGTIIYSEDGSVWNKASTNIFLTLTSVVYAGGTITSFIATSTTGSAIASADADEWSTVSTGTTENLTGLGYNDNFIVAVGSNGKIITSTNGSAWTTRTSPTSRNLQSVKWLTDRWVATGAYSTVLTSIDGINWTFAYTDTFRALARNSTVWVMVGDGGVIYYVNTAVDATEPIMATSPVATNLYDVIYSTNDTKFVAVGAGGKILTSSNGIAWSTQTSGTTEDLNRILYDTTNDRYVAVGNNGKILTSSDAISWSTQTSGVTKNLYGIGLWTGTITYIAVGEDGTILTSQNSTTWVERSSGISTDLNSVVVANNRAVAVGTDGVVLTSDSSGSIIGSTWVTRSSGVTQTLHHVNYLEWTINAITYNQFFATGDSGTLLYSTDASTWTIGDVPATGHLFNIQYGIGKFWISGSVGYSFVYGVDATNYNTLTYQSLALIQNNTTGANGPTLYNSVSSGSYYVVVGQYDTILNSDDGVSFISQTDRTFTSDNLSTSDIYDVIYENDRFTAVGNKGVILTSDTSESWSGTSYTFGNNRTVRTIQRKLDDFVSVKDFGAKGDNITDDTEAINRALFEIYCRNSTVSARKVLWFPAGRYIVSDGINVPTNAILRGEGANNTIIQQTADSSYVSYVMTTADTKQQVGSQIGFNGAGLPSDIVISDIGLESSADAFWLVNASRITLERVGMFGSVNLPIDEGLYEYTGVYIIGSSVSPPTDINVVDCYIEKFNYGIFQPDTETSRNLVFNSVTFNNMYKGMYLCNGDGEVNTMTVSNCIFDLIYDRAIHANHVTNITSTFNSYKDVANNYNGSGNAANYVIDYGEYSVGCSSINDQFDRSYAENLENPWVNGNSTTSAWFGGHNLRIGLFSQQGGETYDLLASQTNEPTGLEYIIADNAFNQRIQYVIVRDNYTRSGILQLVYNDNTNAYSIDDDSTETGDVGVTFSLSGNATSISLDYTSTGTASTVFTLSIAERYIKTAW